MRRFGLVSALLLSLLVCACGNVFVRGFSNLNSQTVNGTVGVVQFTIIVDGNNVSTQVTLVTLINNFGESTFTFCGDQRLQFPLDQFATATFNPGQPCANLLTVVIRVN